MKQPVSKFGLPFLGFGLGLRAPHLREIQNGRSQADWFEIISENFMAPSHSSSQLPFLSRIDRVREKYSVVMHGVSLSIGGQDPLDRNYLSRLKALADEINPPWFSDHLCWTGAHGNKLHDLLPLPYTEETVHHVASRIRQVQDHLERVFVLENVSSYIEFEGSQMKEWEFLAAICQEADCALLLDINNIFVSSYNHGNNATEFINGVPHDRVAQIHLAGPSEWNGLLVDTHDHPVRDEVWPLYLQAIKACGAVSTMIEWDDQIPPLEVVEAELAKARKLFEESQHEDTA